VNGKTGAALPQNIAQHWLGDSSAANCPGFRLNLHITDRIFTFSPSNIHEAPMTTRLQPVDTEKATGQTKEVLDVVNKKFGKVPNIFKLMANSPAAVKGYLAFNEELSKGVLTAKLREQIAITCAELHLCEYCLSAHYAIGKSIGMTDKELEEARLERADDAKSDAALSLARLLLTSRAEMNDNSFSQFRDALTDAEIAEVVANVSLNVFTNYFNLLAQTEIDFPRIKAAFPA
jgi:uncharacterized peroxidase-related enzyme